MKRASSQRSRVPKAAEILADELRSQIFSDGIEPGTQLTTEAELISEYDFSRGTVREALRLLEAESLIEIRRGPQGGIRVTRPDLRQISRSLSLLFTFDETPLRAFFEFRKLVEPYAARLAALGSNEEAKAQLTELSKAGAAAPEDATAFHRVVGEATSNEIFRVLLTALHDVLERHVRIETLTDVHDADVARAHGRISRAIREGDGDGAERAMYLHVEAFEAILDKHGRLDEPIVPRARWQA